MDARHYFKGSIVIGDPLFFVKSDEDWEISEYGQHLSKLGFTAYMVIDFPVDPQIAVNEKNKDIIGGICQDSGIIAVVYKNELELYNPDYERSFLGKENRTVIDDFDGEIEYKTVFVIADGYEDTDTVISGHGNISFRSCYEDDMALKQHCI